MDSTNRAPVDQKNHPDVFWGVITTCMWGMLMASHFSICLLIGLWVQFLKIPYPILFPSILLFSLIGVYSLNNSVAENHHYGRLWHSGLLTQEI